MSQFYDSASLVMVPSGYKSGKIYSQKPLSTSGELSFSRASNATRVVLDASGQQRLEKVRTNLALQSNTFTTTWSQTYVQTPTANAIANPLTGAVDAWKLVEDATDNFHYILQTPTFASGEVSFSFYAKSAERTTCSAFLSQGGNVGGSFNLSTGVATASGTGNTASMVSVGNGWWRCIVTNNGSAAVANQVRIGVADGALINYVGDGTSGIYIYAAQAEQGVATDYIATTSTAVSVGPVSGLPRLDYSGGASCPSLLLEPQRTNDVFPSESFSGYSGTAADIVSNQAIAPDGYNGADLMYPNVSGNFAGRYLNVGGTTTGVVSCFVKQAGKRYAIIGTDNNGTYTCIFDLQTATVVYEATNYTGKIEAYSNGWYRISATYVASAGASYPFIGVADGSNGAVTVDGTNGLYIWGFQYERNAVFSTSYIPTLSSAVTRVADSASKTGISSLIGQTEGTIYTEVSIPTGADGSRTAAIQGGSDRTGITIDGTSVGFFIVTSAGVVYNNVVAYTWQATNKIALAYKDGSTTLYVNGSSVLSTTASFTFGGAMANLYLGQYEFAPTTGQNGQRQSQALLFKTRLTNAQLAELTAL